LSFYRSIKTLNKATQSKAGQNLQKPTQSSLSLSLSLSLSPMAAENANKKTNTQSNTSTFSHDPAPPFDIL
jgi:hypothetical protein